MRRALILSLLAACGGKAAAPARAPLAAPVSDEDFLASGDEGVGADPDCFEGPGANVFEAQYEGYEHEDGVGPGLYINACQWDAAGPVQVITVDGLLLDATAEVESEMDASYRVDAPGYTPPASGDTAALVVLPAVRGARIVALSSGELVAIGDAIQRDYQLPTVPPVPIGVLGVDLDGDGRSEAALVHACFRMTGGSCTDLADLFVHRLDAGWSVPYADPR